MRRFSFWTCVFSLVVSSIFLSSCARNEDTIVLKLAHVLDTGHSVHQGMVHMAERLDHYSNGKMRVDIYPSGQLGAERDTVELVQIGSLAMTKVSAAPLEAFVPAMQVFSIPYVFRSREHYFKALDSAIGKELLASTEVARLKGMGYYDSGSRSFYMVDTPVESPADVAGKKIRVMKSQTAVKMIAAMGGGATPISWGELYTALQQGVVDGAENNPPSFFLSGHYEVCKYFALNEHTSVPDMLLMSSRIWESLDPQQQEWL
jgi:tripartite ATP-independent transporter DctP family solute receptor